MPVSAGTGTSQVNREQEFLQFNKRERVANAKVPC